MPEPLRGSLLRQAVVVTLLILGLGWLGYGYLFNDTGGDRLVLAAVDGTVQRFDGLGAATHPEVGQELQARDRIVAGEGGRAVLALGADARVTVEEKSAVQVVAVDQAGVRLELEGGKVQATVRPGAGSVGIRADGREVTASDADFTVARGDDGTLAVAGTRGDVAVTGVDGASRVGAGERLVAGVGAPALVAPATADLLLQVEWPGQKRVREKATEIRGKTEPGAAVRVGREGAWTTVKADARGEFRATVTLAEGENDVKVEATSILGAAAAVAEAFVLDTTAPGKPNVKVTY